MLLGTINLLPGVRESLLMGLWMSFIVLNCQVVEWVDIFANPVLKTPGIICTEITKEQLLNSFKIGEMSHTCMFFVGELIWQK